jgi:hypothetical protein
LSGLEAKEIRDQMNCMEKKLLQAIADLRVHLAEDYVTKSDQKWAVGIAATISGIFVAVVSSIVNWIRGG